MGLVSFMFGARAALLALGLVGCRQPHLDWQVYNSPGRPPMVDIQCEYRRDCMRIANRVCRNGFDIVDSGIQVERNHVAQAFENYGAAQQKRIPHNYTRVDSALTVQCLAPPVVAAAPGTVAQPTVAPPGPPPPPGLVRDPWK